MNEEQQTEKQIYDGFEKWFASHLVDLKIFFPNIDEKIIRTVMISAYMEGCIVLAKIFDKKI